MDILRGWKTLPIRRWLALALAFGFIVPVFVTAVVTYHVIGIDEDPDSDAATLLRENASRWDDPDWQAAARAELADDGTNFVLVDDGEEIFRSAEDPLAGSEGESAQWQVEKLVVDDGNGEQAAYIYTEQFQWPPSSGALAVPIAAITSLFLTLGGIAWFLGRMVVQPLGGTSQAARQVAAGDLNVKLPSSRVREVAEVNDAFEQMSSELRQSLEQQSSLEQERRLFIGAIAHDLRTPLFSLRGYLEGLQRGVADTPEKRENYIAVAQEKAGTLERLITDLFDFTRLEYLDQAPNQEPLDLSELLRRLVDGLEHQASTKGVDLVFCEGETPCVVNGDSHLLTRVVENLLDNALRHTPSSGQVRVECHVEGDQVRFTVCDTGPGIPAQDLPHIFAPLYRGDESRNRRTGGSGLGLTIARRIMQAHGGDLTARNATSGGAVFTGTLPVQSEHVEK